MSKNSRSKVHPNYKARHRVRNWAEYDQTLVQRGDLTIWFTPETISAWQPRAEGLRGGQRRYSDVAIETALTLRVLYRLPWRQTVGLLRSIFKLLGLELSAPDHTTLSRRAGGLQVELRRLLTTEPVHLIVDATGLGIVGQGQWAAAKWGERGRRGWRKLHIAVDESGRVLAAELTDRRVADAEMLPGLMDQVVGPIRRLTADGGYDTREVHAAAGARGASARHPAEKGRGRHRGTGLRAAGHACGENRRDREKAMARRGGAACTGAGREHLLPLQTALRRPAPGPR